MRARKAKPRLTKTREQGHNVSVPQTAILADKIFVRPSMGAALQQPGHQTPRSVVTCPAWASRQNSCRKSAACDRCLASVLVRGQAQGGLRLLPLSD